MKIILISNYIPDQQESMKRFAEMLDREFKAIGVKTELWFPTVFFGKPFKSTNAGIGKWMGYADKWLLFPLIIRLRIILRGLNKNDIRFHVCDHSNSPYLKYFPAERAAITCHDVIAIRAGLGYTDSNQQPSRFGVLQQKWILSNLRKAKRLAAVSNFTLNQLKDLTPDVADNHPNWRVILNPFNADFYPVNQADRSPLLKQAGLDPDPKYILHVGSGLPRKNRDLLLTMVAELGERWDGIIVYAGEQADEQLSLKIKDLGLEHRVVFVIKPRHEVLRALYSGCQAFVFPSFNEGFGWPVIEAQACGVPVIASNLDPMPEVGGNGTLYASPYKPDDFAEAFLKLSDLQCKAELITRGLENCERFDMSKIIKQYLALHNFEVN